MKIDDMKQAVDDAEATIRNADMLASKMAGLLIGRLRRVGSHLTLNRLKAELRDWDMHKEVWK